jgi:predicted nucleotidyltransferase
MINILCPVGSRAIWTIGENIVPLDCKNGKAIMLSQSQIDIIIRAMLPYHPVRIGIFGSVARGEDSPGSDIDILYHFQHVIKFSKFLNLREYLEKHLAKKVDLVDEQFVHPGMKPHIMNDLKIIYSNE